MCKGGTKRNERKVAVWAAKKGRNTSYSIRFSLGSKEKEQIGRMPCCGIQKTLEDPRFKLLVTAHR